METLLVGAAALGGAKLLLSPPSGSVFNVFMLAAALFMVGTIAVKILKASIYPFYFSPLRHLPGPKDNHFLLGQGLRIMTGASPNTKFVEWVKQWPDAPFIRYLDFGNSEVLLVNNLDACREVLQTKAYSFTKPSFFYKLIGDIVGIGVLFGVGEQHKRLRRLMAGPVSRPNIRKLLPVFREKASVLSSEFDKAIGSETKGVIEVVSLLSRTTLSVICVSIMGKELGTFRSRTSSLTFEECYQVILNPPVIGAVITGLNAFIPLRWLPLEVNRNWKRCNAAVKAMIAELLQERRAELQNVKATGQVDEEGGKMDLLTQMVKASLSESQRATEEELMDTLVQCVSAGHETTASALTWLLYALVTNPKIQKRLRAEIIAAQDGQPNLDAATIDNLHYLNNVVREGLRVYSPTLTSPWEAAEDLVIAGVRIPKGTIVTTAPTMVHNNPSIWGEDAHVFNPDRWDNLSSSAANPFALESFINGPRICPGKHLALLEIKVVLVEIVTNFKLEAVDTDVKIANPGLTLKPKDGLRIRVRRLE